MKKQQEEYSPGQRVKCLDASGSGLPPALTEGREYTVESIREDGRLELVGIEGGRSGWYRRRFALAEEVGPSALAVDPAKPGEAVVFRIGDRVKWETRRTDEERPRWDYEADKGGSGKWESGSVCAINGYEFAVRLLNGATWCWPVPGNSQARYGSPGYVRHACPADAHPNTPACGATCDNTNSDEAEAPRGCGCGYGERREVCRVAIKAPGPTPHGHPEHVYRTEAFLGAMDAARAEALRVLKRTLRAVPFCGHANAPVEVLTWAEGWPEPTHVAAGLWCGRCGT